MDSLQISSDPIVAWALSVAFTHLTYQKIEAIIKSLSEYVKIRIRSLVDANQSHVTKKLQSVGFPQVLIPYEAVPEVRQVILEKWWPEAFTLILE